MDPGRHREWEVGSQYDLRGPDGLGQEAHGGRVHQHGVVLEPAQVLGRGLLRLTARPLGADVAALNASDLIRKEAAPVDEQDS